MQKATVNLVMVCYKSSRVITKRWVRRRMQEHPRSLCPSQQPPSAHRASGLELRSESDKHALKTVLPVLSFIFP